MLNEWQQNSGSGLGSDKITVDHKLTNQKQNKSECAWKFCQWS